MKYENIDTIKTYDELSSTQDKAKEFIKTNKNTLIISKSQTEGRGQKNNKWSSLKGGLYFSFIFNINESEKNIKIIPDLSLITAEVVQKLLLELYKIPTIIKFPNDIYSFKSIKYYKLVGILIETIPQKNKRYIITGIGINFSNEIPLELKETAISIFDLTNKKYKTEPFLKSFFKEYWQKIPFKNE